MRLFFRFLKKNYILLSTVLILLLSALLVGRSISRVSIRENTERRAFNDLRTTAIEQRTLLSDMIEKQYFSLSFLADYIHGAADFSSERNREMLVSLVKTQNLSMLAFVKPDGEAIAYDGTYIGNLSERQYYRDIILDGQVSSVEYLTDTFEDDEPKIGFAVPAYDENGPIGLLLFAKRVSTLEDELLMAADFDQKTEILVLDSSRRILMKKSISTNCRDNEIWGANDSILFEDISPEALAEDFRNGKSGQFVYRNEEECFAVYVPGGIRDWAILCSVSRETATETYQENLNSIRNSFWKICIAYLAVVAYLFLLSWREIHSSIREQLKLKQDRARLSEAVDVEMKQRILHEAEISRLNDALRNARIKNFTGQMQPHFLYNTLASIREIILEDPQYASDLVMDFTTHLRACVKTLSSDNKISFEQEYENIKAYVNIEKMRFGDRLHVIYDVKETDFEVLPLSIQPLIENSIRHGIYPRGAAGGTVVLHTSRDGGNYIVRVKDDGVGFDYDRIKEQVDRGERDSTGLANISFRLETMLYASVRIESVPGSGTEVTVTFPAEKVSDNIH